MLVASGCAAGGLPAPPASRPPAPLVESASADWAYAVRVLALEDLPTALLYLERAADLEPLSASDRAQLYRDLAEVRLALGNRAAAAAAVRASADALEQQPLNARFTPGERRLVQRTLEALQAAADDDRSRLTAACSSGEPPPAVDACYLLGWTDEQHGDGEGARRAYRAYVQGAPAWSFLRRAAGMRQHALAVLAAA